MEQSGQYGKGTLGKEVESWKSNLVGLNEESEFNLVSTNGAEHDEVNMMLRTVAAVLGQGSRKACQDSIVLVQM